MKHSIEEIMEHSEIFAFTPREYFDSFIDVDLHLILSVMTMINHPITKSELSCKTTEDLLNCAEWATAKNKAMIFDATTIILNLGEFGVNSEEFTDNVFMVEELAQARIDYIKETNKE